MSKISIALSSQKRHISKAGDQLLGKRSLAITLVAVLAGCGGGTDKSEVPRPPVTLASQADSLGNYLGTWVSGCGWVLDVNSDVKSVITTYRITSVNDHTMTGTLMQRQFYGSDCSAITEKTGSPFTWDIKATFVAKITSPDPSNTATSSGSYFKGATDKMQVESSVTVSGVTIPISTTTKYFAIGSDNKLYVGLDGNFDGTDLTYSKQ